jgi:predicted ABC-type ATPase
MAIVTALSPPRIHVLAGVNGAGKSSVGGAAIRHFGADFYNPDEAARRLREVQPGLTQEQANSAAWQHGRRLLETAIAQRLDFAFETTLGANTLTRLLAEAAGSGFAVQVWYAGLASPELHLQRVRSRVRHGGHDIPEADIRRRWDRSRLNLIHLLPLLAALRVYDNSREADPATGAQPLPTLVLHLRQGRIVEPADLSATPDWAKPIVAAAIKAVSVRSDAAS